MRTTFRKLAISVMAVILAASLNIRYSQAQHNEKIDVVATYRPVVSDAFKININPVIIDTGHKKMQVEYTILDPKANTVFHPEPITPVRIGNMTVPKLYRFLIKAGWGNYTTPYGEFYYNTLQSKTYNFGVHLKHISSYGKLKHYAYPGFSVNQYEVYGRKMFSKHVLSGNIGYDRHVIHYYGFKPDDYPVISGYIAYLAVMASSHALPVSHHYYFLAETAHRSGSLANLYRFDYVAAPGDQDQNDPESQFSETGDSSMNH